MKLYPSIHLFLLTLTLPFATLAGKDNSPAVAALEKHVYPPELVLEHQDVINLSADQLGSIRKLTLETRSTVAALEWDMQAAFKELLGLMNEESGAESDAILEKLANTLELENGIKIAHMKLVLGIRRLLSAEQKDQLDRLRPKPLPRPLQGLGH